MEKLLRPVLDEMAELNVKVRYFLADSKARVVLMAMTAITGFHGCQYCLARGEPNDIPARDDHGNRNRRGAAVLWPSNTYDSEPRTHQVYMEQAEQAEAEQAPVMGVKGRSCITEFFDDVMIGVPIDFFHCAFLGVSKKIICEILGISSVYRRQRANRQVLDYINEHYPLVEVPSEVQRRPRKIDISTFKASEWKMISIIGFPLVITGCIRFGLRDEARALALYAFLMRAMLLPDDELADLRERVDLEQVMRRFYTAYQTAFGNSACVPNIHLFSHLLEQRSRDALSATSTELFESYYSIIRKSYAKGTPSIGKQIIYNIISHYRAQPTHNCRKKYRYRPKQNDSHDDSYLLTTEGYARITYINCHGTMYAQRLNVNRYVADVVRNLPFEDVGIVKWGNLEPHSEQLDPRDILAKVVRVRDFLVTLPFDCLYG